MSTSRPWYRSEWVTSPWTWLLVIGLIPRIVLSFGSLPILWPDSLTYLASATMMADENNFWLHEVYRTPLYPLFLAVSLKLFGHTEAAGQAVVLVQRLLGIGSGLLLFSILRRAFSGRVALIGAILFLLAPLQLYYETVLLTEAQFTFLLFLFLWIVGFVLAQLQRDERSFAAFAALGLSGAILALSRPIGQLLLLCVLALFMIRFGVRRKVVSGAVVTLSVFTVTIFPWLWVNHHYYGFWGISRDIGINLFHRIVDVDSSPLPEKSTDRFIRKQVVKARRKTTTTYFHVYHALAISMKRDRVATTELKRSIDDRMKAFALEVVRASPDRFVPNSLDNFRRLFFDSRHSLHFCEDGVGKPYLCAPQRRLMARIVSVDRTPPSESARAFTHWYMRAFLIPEPMVSLLFMIGVALCLLRYPSAERLFLLFVVLYFTGLAALLNCPEDRFRLPVDGLIFAFVACGAVGLFDLMRRRATLIQGSGDIAKRSI